MIVTFGLFGFQTLYYKTPTVYACVFIVCSFIYPYWAYTILWAMNDNTGPGANGLLKMIVFFWAVVDFLLRIVILAGTFTFLDCDFLGSGSGCGIAYALMVIQVIFGWLFDLTFLSVYCIRRGLYRRYPMMRPVGFIPSLFSKS